MPLSKYVHIRRLSFLSSTTADRSARNSSPKPCCSSTPESSNVLPADSIKDPSDSPSKPLASNSTNNASIYVELEFSDIILELNNLTETFFNITGV